MKNLKRLSLFSSALFAFSVITLFSCQQEELEELNAPTPKLSATTGSVQDLARRWAPIHYQDVDATGTYSEGGKSDYITAINYDGDWNAENNWNNLPGSIASAHCYYSVVETNTHWFITYAFFHPRDWTDIFFLYSADQHENDLEGILMVVKKDGSAYGSLQGAVTVSHSDFFSYTTSGSSLYSGLENVDGTLNMISYNGELHPVTAQEAKGHGLKAWPQYDINGDGVIYYPSMNGNAQVPADNYDNYVEYKLVNIFEPNGLWDQRFNTALFFNVGGGFKGNDFKSGGANAPWAWNDGNDGIVQGGEIATNPAKLVDNYFDGVGNFSHSYVDNQYSNDAGGVVTLYQHCDYQGYAVALRPGSYTLSQLQSQGVVNDDLSSLRVEGGHSARLYEHDNFAGNSILISGNDHCLDGFNDDTSSLVIY